MGFQSQSPSPSRKWHLRNAEPRPLWAYRSHQQDLVRFTVNNAQWALRGNVTVSFTRSWKPACHFLVHPSLSAWERGLAGPAGLCPHTLGQFLVLPHGCATRWVEQNGFVTFTPQWGPSPPLLFGNSKHSPREAWRWNSAWALARSGSSTCFQCSSPDLGN